MPTREETYIALFTLGATLSWGNSGVQPSTFVYSARRVKTPEQLGVALQPALCQAEWKETTTQIKGLPPKRLWRAAWFIYFYEGNDDAITATMKNAILDAVDLLFPEDPAIQTLNGLVDKVWIDGDIEVYGGNLDSQVMLVMPLVMQIP